MLPTRTTFRSVWQVAGWLVGLLFVVSGLLKLAPWHPGAAAFAHSGYPEWVFPMVALIEVVGGAVLLLPPFWGLGAGVFALAATGGAVAHLATGSVANSVLPFVLLIPVSIVGLGWWRRSAAAGRWRAALDAFAERELAARGEAPVKGR
jgi:uncharacterized membrane protein YphA (DoxX/SURF4 family)